MYVRLSPEFVSVLRLGVLGEGDPFVEGEVPGGEPDLPALLHGVDSPDGRVREVGARGVRAVALVLEAKKYFKDVFKLKAYILMIYSCTVICKSQLDLLLHKKQNIVL